ncbi:MAG: hypothetical protein AAF696_37065 [Bacteroidota bacterium]
MKTQAIALCFLAFSFLFPSLYAQEVNIDWGEKVELKEKVFEILGENSEGIYSIGGKGKKFFLENFDSQTYEKKFSKEIIIKEEDGLKTQLAKMLLLDENLIMLTYVLDKSAKEARVYGYLLDKNGKARSKRVNILTSSFEKKSRSGYQDIRISRDRSKLLVCNQRYFKKPDERYKIDLTLFSADLEPIKSASSEIALNDDIEIEISNFFVENDGSFHMAVSEKDRVKGEYITRKFWIYSYMPFNGFEEQKIPIELDGKTATSIALTSDLEGNLIGAGFYGENYKSGLGRRDGLAGSYFIKIDPTTNEVLNSSMQEFPTQFTAKVLKEKKAAKGKLIPNFFYPLEIIGKSDGGAVMVSEYYLAVEGTNGRTITHYHGPLAIVDIDREGEINWVKAVPKNQVYVESRVVLVGFLGPLSLSFAYTPSSAELQTVYHSALFGVNKDKLYVLYNDNPKNEEIEHFRDTKPLRGYLGSVPVVIEIDAAGNMEKALLEDGKGEVVLRPGASLQVKPGETLLYGTRKRHDKMGRVTY